MPRRIFSRLFGRVDEQKPGPAAPKATTPTFTQNIFTSPHQIWLDNNGEPLAGGRLYVYKAGTSTPVDTWQDAALTQVNTNPVILDGGGFATVWLDPTQIYKFRMTDRRGMQQWTIDDYAGGSLTANILVPINYLLSATGTNQINNGNNLQSWLWSLTGTNPTNGLFLGEVAPSTAPAPSTLVTIGTLPGSTAGPFNAVANEGPTPGSGTGLRITSTGDITSVGGANIFTNIIGGGTQCVQVDNTGRLFGTGVPCGSGGTGPGGGIQSINTDTTIAQQIIGTGAAQVSTAGGVTTIYVPITTGGTPILNSIVMSPTSVLGGSANSTGTVTLTTVAPTGGAVVTLTSSNTTAVTVPASVTIAAGTAQVTFTATSHSVTSNTTVTITGNYGANQSANLTVTAPVPVQPIYGGVGQPGATSSMALSGTNVTLSTGDVIHQLQTTPEQVGQTWTFSPNNQVVYLLLFGGSHTFTDAGTGLVMAFNAPIACSLSGVSMYLYQTTNQLYGTSKPKIAS